MSLKPQDLSTVPEETARVAHAAFPKGNPYLTLRDELGALYEDETFAPLFAETRGRPAESPGRRAVVTALQFVEHLSDRQAANAVRARIDWKYLLGLELTDPGFDHTILHDFRERVLEGGVERQLLDVLLERLKARELIKERGKQRTDSTYVVTTVRQLNRLECVGETLRHALNSLAVANPQWLREKVAPEWFERYAHRFEQGRLPDKKSERDALGETIGRDGHHLLEAIYEPTSPHWLRHVSAVETLRRVWVQQYYIQEGKVHLREADDLPPGAQLIVSPYDVEARKSVRRSIKWMGYRVHLTETCEGTLPSLITNVETCPATTGDVELTASIHRHLAEKEILPGEHLLDQGYTDAQILVDSKRKHKIELIGPVQKDVSWQARTEGGFDISRFAVDWEAQEVTCPQGKRSRTWSNSHDNYGNPVIHIRFDKKDCLACSQRAHCTHSREGPRTLKLRSRDEHIALQQARKRQETTAFKEKYKRREGIEGTISQGTRRCGLRRSRYRGLAKTHLQHVCTAIAIDLIRLANWFAGTPRASTRCSPFAALAST
jgi:transposase